MRRLINWFNILIKKRKELKRWQRIVTVLAAVITFATTYALILPAITVEKDNTGEVAGMYLEKTADLDVLQEENALEPIGVSIAADMDNAVTFAYSDEDMTATAVFSTDEEIPEGTELVVNLVAPESEEYADLRSRSVDLLDKEFIYDVTTCSFYDYALICDNIDVTPKTGLADIQIIFRNNTVEHTDDMLFAGRFAKPAEEDELVSINSDESSVIEITDGIITSLALKGNDLSRSDSIVGILAGNVDEETKAAAAETDAEIPDSDGTQEASEVSGSTETDGEEISTALPVKTLKVSGSDYTVTLSYDESSGIPDEAVLAVSEIAQDSKEYQTYLKEAKKAMGLKEVETLPSFAARFFDIKIMVDNQEFTPETGVSVEITYTEPLAEHPDTEVSAVHFADESAEAEVIEANTAEVQDDGQATVEFTAESFSVYGVIYTVDFHWEVNGKTYDFSIPGGGFVSFYDLVKILDIETDNPDTEKDEIQELVDGVENITFSNPELVSISRVEEDTTVEAIKEHLQLECVYSVKLSEEQIETINTQEVKAGDWAIISLKPFDSAETLTVNMKNGEQFVVQVTDAHEITSSGASEINVNKSYLICYETGEGNSKVYYILKNDGSADVVTKSDRYYYINGVQQSASITSISDLFESLNSTNFWSFNYIFTEKDVLSTLNNNYYLIRPIDLRSKTLTLNDAGEPIVQSGNNNTAVIPDNDDNGNFSGFVLQGYHNVGTEDEPRFIKLGFDGTNFISVDGNGVTLHVYEMDALPSFDYSVSANKLYGYDYSQGPRGSVSVQGVSADSVTESNPNDHNDTTVYSFDVYNCTSTADKKNGAVITANCARKTSSENGADPRDNKWLFDHWELDGVELPSSAYTVVEEDYKHRPLKVQIETNSLEIPFNGSKLVAFFRQNPDYKAPDSEKQPTSFADMSEWFDNLTDPNREIPFDSSATEKTAEVYDYENRIYRVDIKTKADYESFSGDIDIGFSLDVSNSMKFPASLKTATYRGNSLDSFSIYALNDNTSSLDKNRRFNNPYYVIADKNQTATVLRLYYEPNDFRAWCANDNQWKYYSSGWYVQDAAFDEHAFNKSTPRFNRIGKENFKPMWSNETLYWLNSGDNYYSQYTIYDHGDEHYYDRFHYLRECFQGASGDLETIMETLRIAGDESPDVYMAYNTFCKEKKTTSVGTMAASELHNGETNAFYEAVETDVNFAGVADGGTRPDLALDDARKWNWRSPNKYLILITDGAPQGGENTSYDGVSTGSQNSDRVNWADDAAADLKKGKDGVVGFNNVTGDNDDVKIISIGLSMRDVEEGRKLLYRIADKNPKTGDPMFYLVDDASDLRNVLRQIIRTLMEQATINTDITDTVGEAFYLVDKRTGLPLNKGDKLDIDGNVTTDSDKAVGIVLEDGRTVKWLNQSVDGENGWHGTVYVKAKEDLIGGNAVKTNEEAKVEANSYTVSGVTYDFVEDQTDPRLKLTIPFEESPRVNVNELTFSRTTTEWTVYLGTEVDPAKQIKRLYELINVEKVVNVDGDENGRLHYSLKTDYPDDISDGRDNPNGQDDRVGTADKLLLAPIILDRIINDPGSSNELKSRYLEGDNLNWTNFLTDILKTGGVTIPYHPYGIEGADSNLVITLEKKIKGNEESDLLNHSPHVTTETGIKKTEIVGGEEVVTEPAVEEYVLTVRYNPDYKNVLPHGQGGNNNYDFHTGTYGSKYQGHSAGRETSINTHVINVYNFPLDVYKTDENNRPLAGATFRLYEEDAVNGVPVPGLVAPVQGEGGASTGNNASSGKYKEVAHGTSGTDGIAHLLGVDDTPFCLVKGKTYYLIETEAPTNYSKVNSVWAVEVQTEIGKFTDLNGNTIYSGHNPPPIGTGVTTSMYPFNWDQRARIVLNGKQPATAIVKGVEEGTTTEITNGSFVSVRDAISFRHTVQNIGGKINITLNKYWDDNNDQSRPSSVTVQLYRVSEKDHVWGNGHVVPCACTDAGVEEYTCSICGKKQTRVINAAGHKAGTAHRENESEPTCTTPGGYDTVVRCTVCNAIISTEHTHKDALGHLWGAWEVTTEPQPGVAGEETRVCQRDPSHVETNPIAALPNETAISYTTYRDWYTRGWHEDDVTTSEKYQIGSRITLSWSSRIGYNATLYVNGTERNPRYVDGDYQNGYSLSGDTYSVTRTYSGWPNYTYNYQVTVTVTDGMTLFLKSDIWDAYPSNITITRNRSVQNSSPSRNIMAASLPTRSAMTANSLLNGKLQPLRGDAPSSTAMTTETLQTFLNNLHSKDGATCKEEAGAIHTYKEYVGEYTIEGTDWTLSIPELPKYNEYGKEYKYYVIENPITGYSTTYSGQEDGLKDGSTNLEITNSQKMTEVTVTKSWIFAVPSEVELVSGKNWPKDVSIQIVLYEKIGSAESVPTSHTATLTSDQQSYTFTGLPEYSGENRIEYSIVESGITGLDSDDFTTVVEGDAESGYTIINTERPKIKDFSFTKRWRNPFGTSLAGWPSGKSITVTIRQDNVDYAVYTISSSDLTLNTEISALGDTTGSKKKLVVTGVGASTGYTFSLFGLPYGDAPDGYTYYVSEESVDGYQPAKYFKHDGTQAMGADQITDEGIIYNDQIVYELPATGGPGTSLIYFLGIILTCLAGAGLMMRKRCKTW